MGGLRRLAAAAPLCLCSCILEPSGPPGYPHEYGDSWACDSLGAPASCAFSSDGAIWAVACEGGVLLAGEGIPPSGWPEADGAADIAFVPGTGAAAACCGESLVVVQDGGAAVFVRLPSHSGLVTPSGDGLLVSGSGGDLTSVSPGWEVLGTVTTSLDTVTGLCVPSWSASAFASDGACILEVDPATGGTLDSMVPGPEIIALFDAGTAGLGMVPADGNELWILEAEPLRTSTLITFPHTLEAGAAPSDGQYCYGCCPGSPGLVVCSVSGEQVWSTDDFGSLSDVALSSSGDLALLASVTGMSAVLLER